MGRGRTAALMYCRIMVLTTSQREALKLLANAADGYTVPFMLGHGCSVAALRRLARCGLAGKAWSADHCSRSNKRGRKEGVGAMNPRAVYWWQTMIAAAVAVMLAAMATGVIRMPHLSRVPFE
jgi:hypothetical protein